jgi:hypothetical protein
MHESESDYDDQGIGNVRQLNRKDRRITDNKMRDSEPRADS